MMKLALLFLLMSLAMTAAKAQNCESSAPECVALWTETAVKNSQEIKNLTEAIRLAKRKQWTSLIDVSTIEPITASIQIIRNVLGGGRYQENKQLIHALELRRSETITRIRERIIALLLQIEQNRAQLRGKKTALENFIQQIELFEVQYRAGDFDTEKMLSVWEKRKTFRAEIESLRAEIKQAEAALERFAHPEITKEEARESVIKQVTEAWKLSGTTEELNLIVLDADEKKRVFKSELLKIFPEGVKHLPDELQPRGVYSTTRNGLKKVQCIGMAERFGFNFVLFRTL
ncbi:MAG: TolC family protein [Acidobacteria bacterium]|nr:TolC family protein [Acidobacteriota bacterium]MCA1638348.1 TolC family protein [Acidobacteriota bacterium]